MRLAQTTITYEEIAVLLDLPPDVRILSIDQETPDKLSGLIRVTLTGPRFYEHQRGTPIWQTRWPPEAERPETPLKVRRTADG